MPRMKLQEISLLLCFKVKCVVTICVGITTIVVATDATRKTEIEKVILLEHREIAESKKNEQY